MPEIPQEWTSLRYWAALVRNIIFLAVALHIGLVWSLSTEFADKDVERRVNENSLILGELAGGLREVKEDVKGVKSLIMRDRIFELKIKQCDAERAGTRQFYAREAQELITEYMKVTGEQPPSAPGCDELQ